MNYPIWELSFVGGGSLIAIIAILHVYISHLAVGGGLFLWLTDLKSVRDNDPGLRAYVRRHTWFFLLLTMVFGGMSGVGIWFIIALVQPAATSVLIHNFVFGWAIEWVFFIGEIAALLVYHYRFEKMTDRDRLVVAFLYFAFAWLSMVIINGILSFMLTPGDWLTTRNFWDGFLNPTYLSSLVFRTAMAVVIAGLFAFVTVSRSSDEAFRQRVTRYSTKWLLIPLAALVPAAAWYFLSLPVAIRERAFGLNPQTQPVVLVFVVGSALLFVAGALMGLRSGRKGQAVLTALLLVIGLGWMGAYEYTREVARKPFVIGNYLYSTSIALDQVDLLNKEGVLAHARWSAVHEVTPENTLQAGEELYRLECAACHTRGGLRNNILPRIKPYTYMGTVSLLSGQGKVRDFMPPFVGTEAEKAALAAYLTVTLNGKKLVEEPAEFAVGKLPDSIPPFNRAKDDYVLLAWNDLGMHCISDNEAYFSFLPPANTLEAQLIRRGNPPSLVKEGVELAYEVEKGFENPERHVGFWDYSKPLFGTQLAKGIGLFGKGVKGVMDPEKEGKGFIAAGVPVVPYNDNGSYNPYPTFAVTAKDGKTGAVLASTRMVAPVSTEMGCRNCHEGPWRTESKSGVSDETAANFLDLHDRINGTQLLAGARKGQPSLCQSCHADPALGAKGKPEVLNFSSAMHGWHANYIDLEDSTSCQLCHPSFARGNTRCLRDLHGQMGVECVSCHGTLQEHALSLLKAQAELPAAPKLMARLKVKDAPAVKGRVPWVNEPDCLTCHKDYLPPESRPSAFNTWNQDFSQLYRQRTDPKGIRCEACHSSTHAVYPAMNSFGKDRDVIQPLQYQGKAMPIGSDRDCGVCHTVRPVAQEGHHPQMLRMFRNTWLLE